MRRLASRPLPLLAATVVTLAGACQPGDGSTTAAATTRDSAGVTILEHQLADAPTWTLAPRPLLRIGTVSGDSTQELYRVRAAGFLRGGRLAVAVDGSHELRVYDSTGALVRTIGRAGGGPGEFRFLNAMWTPGGDSLAAYDGRLRRLTVFDDTGAVVRSSRYAVIADSLHGGVLSEIVGLLADGRAVGFASDTGGPFSGLRRPTGSLLVFDGAGHVVARPGRAGAAEVFFGKPVNTPQGPMVPFSTSPFARTTLLAVGSDRIYVADNAHYDVRVVSPDGTLRTLLRADVPPLSIGDEDFRRIADSSLSAIGHPEAAAQMIGAIREATPFDTMPALASLAVDAEDRLWVEERARPGSPSRRIAAYDARGALVGALALPSPLRLLGAAGDRVIVLRRGDSDEEYVEVYGLVRGG